MKVLATSREGIGVADELLWRVPSLDVGAAVELFVERAQSMVSDTLADEATAVADVCRRLDGIPLAIELAASRMASMTAAEVRDRLDDRFKLLVGSRRGLERHQTLRHAVAWSYDLLDDAEKTVLERCSVFAGGFDLKSACAIAGSDDIDEYAILDLLDALVRKSLLVADRSSGRTRFSMLETIRQFAEEQLVASRRGDRGSDRPCSLLRRARNRHPGPVGQPPPAGGLRLVHRRAGESAHRVSVGRRPRRSGCRRRHRHIRGVPRHLVENNEPIAWAEELIEPARAVDHPRLAALYVMASQCWMPGRIEAAVRYSDAAQKVIGSGRASAVRPSRAGWALCTCASASPNGGRVVPRPTRTRSRHSRIHQGKPGIRTGDRRVRVRRRWPPRTVWSTLPRPPATRMCSRTRCSPTGSPSATPIPSARLMRCAGAW